MDITAGIEFSDDAELSRYFFYKDYNDITFFAEDKDKEFEYERILNRLFDNKFSISSIITPGGKAKVIEAFREFGEFDIDNPKKQNIYIVDGDFDRIIHENDMVINEHFIYLNYYNIENYFIDKNAVSLFMCGKLGKRQHLVEEKIKFELWNHQIINQAKDLFLLYCAIQKSIPEVQNVSRKEYKFINFMTGFAYDNAYCEYYNEIIGLNNDIDDEILYVNEKYHSIYGEDYSHLICGKFLLCSLYSYLRSICSVKFPKDELRWFLICNFDVNKLNAVKDKIEHIMQHA